MLIPIEVTRLVDQERRQDAERRGRWLAIIRDQRRIERRHEGHRGGAGHRARLGRLFARLVAVARRLWAAIDRRLSDHTIPRLDASAEALWPANPEEADPPRWQLHLIEPRPRHTVEDAARSEAPMARTTPYRPGRAPRVTE